MSKKSKWLIGVSACVTIGAIVCGCIMSSVKSDE